ncbi:Uncharacterised protein [Mycobacteroides abscessus subsp. abscessus]|nr:Uncharacterised protein [Mycobacteroides abscessus subsp. abscessus]
MPQSLRVPESLRVPQSRPGASVAAGCLSRDGGRCARVPQSRQVFQSRRRTVRTSAAPTPARIAPTTASHHIAPPVRGRLPPPSPTTAEPFADDSPFASASTSALAPAAAELEPDAPSVSADASEEAASAVESEPAVASDSAVASESAVALESVLESSTAFDPAF